MSKSLCSYQLLMRHGQSHHEGEVVGLGFGVELEHIVSGPHWPPDPTQFIVGGPKFYIAALNPLNLLAPLGMVKSAQQRKSHS